MLMWLAFINAYFFFFFFLLSNMEAICHQRQQCIIGVFGVDVKHTKSIRMNIILKWFFNKKNPKESERNQKKHKSQEPVEQKGN